MKKVICEKGHISFSDLTVHSEKKNELFFCPVKFERRGGHTYYVEDGVRYRVKQFIVVANGIRDLCVAKDPDCAANIKKISDVAEKDILFIPKNDLLWVKLCRPIQGNHWSLVFEIVPEIKEMLLSLHPDLSLRGADFEMYAGDDYGI